MDDYVEFVDDVRHVYLDGLRVGPAAENMISFLFSCPKLSRREYTWNLFKLCCIYLGHVAAKLFDFSLGSSKVGVTGVNMSCVIEPVQRNLLSCEPDGNFLSALESISTCLELLETFCDRALQSNYNPWVSVDVHGYGKIRDELENSYKAKRVASDVESSSSFSEPAFVSEKLPERRRRPA